MSRSAIGLDGPPRHENIGPAQRPAFMPFEPSRPLSKAGTMAERVDALLPGPDLPPNVQIAIYAQTLSMLNEGVGSNCSIPLPQRDGSLRMYSIGRKQFQQLYDKRNAGGNVNAWSRDLEATLLAKMRQLGPEGKSLADNYGRLRNAGNGPSMEMDTPADPTGEIGRLLFRAVHPTIKVPQGANLNNFHLVVERRKNASGRITETPIGLEKISSFKKGVPADYEIPEGYLGRFAFTGSSKSS